MEYLLIGIIIILFVVCIFLFWKNGQAIPMDRFNLLQNEKQQQELSVAKLEQQVQIVSNENATLKVLLEKERNERSALERTLEGTNAYLQAQQEKFQDQKQEIVAIKSQFNTEFQVLANKILDEKAQKFTALNQQNMGLILDPLKDRIKSFEDKVEKTYSQEAAERNVLKGVVEQLMAQSVEIKNEANNLSKALKGDSKKQGNWGEVILERVLERSGLTKDQEYRLQVSMLDDQGRRLQPDAIIDLPDDKQLIVDSKVSLVAYEKVVNSDNEEERALYLKQHILSVENHVKELSAKNYQNLYGIHSPDFVLLFMPIESALSLAVMQKPDIFSDAWDRRVVIVSPSTLLATLRTIAAIWKQERQNRNVLEIAREAGALYDKFVGFLQDMQHIQTHLDKASEKHEDAMRKLSTGPGNVVRKIEVLKSLGAKANKQIDDKYLE
ncbi:DNA recombination protein RmuC [Sphingobacterium rhinopitheci]|uniref:DNA recombination protein RmuC n=1 Tax=Sphingobacterium rhinopitheci TaxID=2781960 RepID=UPI001F516890|nr:DNA recombination protein RmuC [Sphingobacterium rhinopitheci]MCI0920472.1 DNA recombination protein RmuC [Sphingobacterium rhinopitheci]